MVNISEANFAVFMGYAGKTIRAHFLCKRGQNDADFKLYV